MNALLLDKQFLHLPAQSPFYASMNHGSLSFNVSRSSEFSWESNDKRQTLLGLVLSGSTQMRLPLSTTQAQLGPDMYFAVNSSWSVTSSGDALFVQIKGYHGLNMIGGPLEVRGRLKYIDSCTDSLLIPPTIWGDPCLNLLAFPPGIKQSTHLHPSFRCGIVLSGRGFCLLEKERLPLNKGDFFFIPANLKHCFHSDEIEGLRVIALHPDSDFGPTDMNHPMINRTYLGAGEN